MLAVISTGVHCTHLPLMRRGDIVLFFTKLHVSGGSASHLTYSILLPALSKVRWICRSICALPYIRLSASLKARVLLCMV